MTAHVLLLPRSTHTPLEQDRDATPMLKILFRNKEHTPVWLVDKSYAIGRADDNQLVLDDPTISARHARILAQNQTYMLRDLGSEQGTYVNGHRITQKALATGDVVRIGNIELEVIDPLLDPRTALEQKWSLVACSSWLSGQEFPLRPLPGQSTLRIGRGAHCEVTFPGTHLSREHVALELRADSIQVTDLNSANGTFINDEPVTEGVVRPGDKLRLDVYSFRVLGPQSVEALSDRARHLEAQRQQGKKALLSPAPPSPPIEPPKPKHWKTRPTSPGNRPEDHQPITTNHTALKIIAGFLLLSAIGFGIYLLKP